MASNPKSTLFGKMCKAFGEMELGLAAQLDVIEGALGYRKLHTKLDARELKLVLIDIGVDPGPMEVEPDAQADPRNQDGTGALRALVS